MRYLLALTLTILPTTCLAQWCHQVPAYPTRPYSRYGGSRILTLSRLDSAEHRSKDCKRD